MKRLCMTCVVVGLTALVGMAGPCGAQPTGQISPETADLVKGNTAFALDLYGKVGQKEGNLFFSPYSISTALAMTYAGARGTTAEEMAKTLHFPHEQSNLHRVYGELIGRINGKGAAPPIRVDDRQPIVGATGLRV